MFQIYLLMDFHHCISLWKPLFLPSSSCYSCNHQILTLNYRKSKYFPWIFDICLFKASYGYKFCSICFFEIVASLQHCTINHFYFCNKVWCFCYGFLQYMKQHDLKWYLALIPYNSESFYMISWVTSDSLVLITMVTFSSVKNYSPWM